jgi:glutamine synthetase
MLGSSNSIACANSRINSAVAECLKVYADELEGAADFNDALKELLRKTIKEHKKILFNGNGYDDAWIEEATKARGLSNYRTTPDCMPHLLDEKNVRMLTSHRVFSEVELKSRCEIMLENYCKQVIIEANTMISMVRTGYIPAIMGYTTELAKAINVKKAADVSASVGYETTTLRKLSSLKDFIASKCDELAISLESVRAQGDIILKSNLIRDELLPDMNELRAMVDEAETMTAAYKWPYPSYADLLFSVK